jgi:thioredoxin-related protein/uncharacterized membrane protein YphA (DoxX/SURF4 family)
MIDALTITSRIFLFLVFVIAGLGKLFDIEGGKKSLNQMGFSARQAAIIGIILPFAELMVAISFLPKQTALLAAISSLILLLGFSVFTAYQIKKGKNADCHCFGALHSEPISPKVIYRNLLLSIPAIFLVLQPHKTSNIDLLMLSLEQSIILIFASLMSLLLVLIANFLNEIVKKQNEMIRRIELLSLSDQTAHEHPAEIGLTNPTEGLPIGSPVPYFKATNAGGQDIESTNLFNKPTILLFVQPSCEACSLLLPEVEAWYQEVRDRFNLYIISTGDIEENISKYGKENLILQKGTEISDAFKSRWTPTAVFISHKGRIGSALAAGDKAIKNLLTQLKSQDQPEFIAEGNEERDGKIGLDVPEFTLTDLHGNQFHSRQFIGRKTLLLYWSPNCGFCKEMLEELRKWEENRKPYDPALILLSASNELEKNNNLKLRSPILIDEKREVANMFGMKGTPSAVLIDENARIISQIAIGAEQIWALVGGQN